MKSLIKKQKLAVYVFEGRSILCPESGLEKEEIVVSLWPLHKVDPLGRYQYVINQEGTHTVSKDRLRYMCDVTVAVDIPRLSTRSAEKLLEIEAAKGYLRELKQEANASSN